MAAEGDRFLTDRLKSEDEEEAALHMLGSVPPAKPVSPSLSDRHTAEQQNPPHKPLQHYPGTLSAHAEAVKGPEIAVCVNACVTERVGIQLFSHLPL